MDRVKTYTDRRNRVTGYAYDTLGRLTTTTFPGSGGTLTSAYDPGNRLTSLVDSISGTLGWTYDNFDAVTQANGPQGTIYYTYDAAGRSTNMQAASQTQVQYNYDNADRLLGIAQGTEAVTFAYDNANRLTTTTLPNQVQTVYTYNDADQVTGMAWGKAGQTALGSLGYGYNSSGELVAQTGTHAPQSLPPASINNTFDDNNRQTMANNATLSYDGNGNLTSDGSRTYVWDDRDRLVQIKSGNTVIASFSYDAMGRRVAKTESGTATTYLYDGFDAVQEMQGAAVNPILTGGGIDQRYARNEASGRTYFSTDLLGSTRILTNASGALVQRYDYDPYGTTTQSSAGTTNPYQFTGGENDLSGLYYYRARYYQPGRGRFLSEDPIQLAAGPNSYLYTSANPVSLIDPLGLEGTGPWSFPPGAMRDALLIDHAKPKCISNDAKNGLAGAVGGGVGTFVSSGHPGAALVGAVAGGVAGYAAGPAAGGAASGGAVAGTAGGGFNPRAAIVGAAAGGVAGADGGALAGGVTGALEGGINAKPYVNPNHWNATGRPVVNGLKGGAADALAGAATEKLVDLLNGTACECQ